MLSAAIIEVWSPSECFRLARGSVVIRVARPCSVYFLPISYNLILLQYSHTHTLSHTHTHAHTHTHPHAHARSARQCTPSGSKQSVRAETFALFERLVQCVRPKMCLNVFVNNRAGHASNKCNLHTQWPVACLLNYLLTQLSAHLTTCSPQKIAKSSTYKKCRYLRTKKGSKRLIPSSATTMSGL